MTSLRSFWTAPIRKATEEVARFQAIEGKTWNIPAFGHGLLW